MVQKIKLSTEMDDFENLSGPMSCSCDFLVCLCMYFYGRLQKNVTERLKRKVIVDLDYHNFLAYGNQFSSVLYYDGRDFIRNVLKITTVVTWRKTFASLLHEILFSAFLQA